MSAGLPPALSVLLALGLGLVSIALVQGSLATALEAYAQMLAGGLGDWSGLLHGEPAGVVTRPLGEAGVKAALLILTGLSVAAAGRAGLFNIGAQGQFLVGALAAALVGAGVPLPALLHIALALVAAALAGGAWALIAAGLRLWRGVHEVLSTILLNWVAALLIEDWLVVGPLRAPSSGGASQFGTAEILPTAVLPRLLGGGSRLNLGLLIALLCAVATWAWLFRTHRGFETRAVGLGPEAARASGLPVNARMAEAFGIAGALAGLGGAVLVLGTEGHYPATVAAPYGFDGISISLLGSNHPVGVVLASLLFGVLRAGGTRMQLLGVYRSFPELLQGLALVFVAGRQLWLRKGKPRFTETPREPENPAPQAPPV